ncbi:hypothetical protein F2Q69_00007344 [Brassica cretica]|uniref:Uncharacterized protein n=1 Tax=Brassica cretica TaxID=69181 RepID=A0A8S9P409_BRACR|nr:hypothetical protein F2Q69_00007344 [Brassica cretica]
MLPLLFSHLLFYFSSSHLHQCKKDRASINNRCSGGVTNQLSPVASMRSGGRTWRRRQKSLTAEEAEKLDSGGGRGRDKAWSHRVGGVRQRSRWSTGGVCRSRQRRREEFGL